MASLVLKTIRTLYQADDAGRSVVSCTSYAERIPSTLAAPRHRVSRRGFVCPHSSGTLPLARLSQPRSGPMYHETTVLELAVVDPYVASQWTARSEALDSAFCLKPLDARLDCDSDTLGNSDNIGAASGRKVFSPMPASTLNVRFQKLTRIGELMIPACPNLNSAGSWGTVAGSRGLDRPVARFGSHRQLELCGRGL